MPDSTEDARTVQGHIDRIFDADPDDRAEAIRRLFVEVLDFNAVTEVTRQVSLAGAAKTAELPDFAERIASLDDVQVLWVALATKRVNKREATEAARLIERDLGDDLLLVFTNGDASQLHLILPDFTSGTVPKLRRRTVERGLPQRTAYEQIAGIYSEDDPLPVRQALKKAFDVEPVTRDFFRKYDELFKAAKGLVTGLEDEERHLFVQTLFNRLLFVHFLSRKGWLTFEDDKDYLKALWRDYQATEGETNFNRDRLGRLFFDGLSNPESRIRDYPDIGKVPFLNGGLFEETDLDKREGVVVPDSAIEPVLNDLFGTFNFTVMESTPFDVEVAVDPEMLGKVFEELVTGRHDSGSYYTPRPVVSFMCREALKGYLEGATGLDASAIARFVDDHDEAGIPQPDAFAVSDALHAVTVVDPACGSGAYLLGMMQELIELWAVLYSDRLKNDAREHYELKLDIIKRNLYGVDNDRFATNIAMLRLWLSLSIDYDGAAEPPPLPNLDFKIVCGDSLLGPDPSGLSFNRVFIEQSGLDELEDDYLRADDDEEKKRLRADIAKAREQVRADLGSDPVPESVIDWRLEFTRVFSGGGFDIVIGNPPYVEARSSSVSASLKEAYRAQVERDWGSSLPRGSDLLMFFFPRAARLMHSGGRGILITQNSWLSTDYGQKFQQFSIGRFSFSKVIDTEGKFFASSDGPNINAIISAFSRESASSIEYVLANSAMDLSPIKTVAADSTLKWGALFAMPESLEGGLAALSARPQVALDASFGQGLNFPKRELNSPDSATAIIVGDVGFVASSADGMGPPVNQSRANRIPALVMPRGVGDRYYCTFNACRAFSWSAVELYLPDVLWDSDTHYCLWAYLNSSLAWLFREVTGRKNLGGGMLKAEATDMKALPIGFDYDFAAEAKYVHGLLQHRQALPVWDEVNTPEHRAIDDMVGSFFGISADMESIRRDLVEQVRFRVGRSRR